MSGMFLALREIRRAPVRFALLAAAVGLLVFLILFQGALRDGLITQFIGALRNQSAPVLVFGDQARKNIEGSQVTPEQQRAIAAVDGVVATGRIGEGTFTVSTGTSRAETTTKDRLLDAVLFGYDLEAGLGAPTTLSKGRLPRADNEAVASERNRDEGFGIGERVRIEPGGSEIEIVGLASDTNYSVSPTLFTSWATYEAARRIRNPDATAVQPSLVAVQPDAGVAAGTLTSRINAAVDGVEALTRQEAVDGSPGVSSVRESLSFVILILYIAVLLVVGLFLLILTVQKSGPLTLLRAIGADTRRLASALLVQTVLLVAGGSVVGILLALGAAQGTKRIGIGFDVAAAAGPILLVLVCALASSAVAVTRVVRIDPIEATKSAGALR